MDVPAEGHGIEGGPVFKVAETCKYLDVLGRWRKALLSFVCTLEAPGIFLKKYLFFKKNMMLGPTPRGSPEIGIGRGGCWDF